MTSRLEGGITNVHVFTIVQSKVVYAVNETFVLMTYYWKDSFFIYVRYYINYFTKHTSLEDPRIKYKKLQAGDSFTFQVINKTK